MAKLGYQCIYMELDLYTWFLLWLPFRQNKIKPVLSVCGA